MQKNQGFTLIELIITIAILAIIATIGIPSFGNMITREHLKTTSYQMRDTLKEARSKAMLNQKETVVCTSKMTEITCSEQLTNSENLVDSVKKDSMHIVNIEKKISSPSSSDHYVVFSARGSSSSVKTITFCSNLSSYIVSVGLSGVIEISQGAACS